MSTAGILRLRRLLPSLWSIQQTNSIEAVTSALASGHGVVVVDPSQLVSASLGTITRAATRTGHPLIVYTRLEALSICRICEVTKNATAEVVFHGADAESALLERRIREVPSSSASSLVLRTVISVARKLPQGLDTAVVGLFGGLPIPASTGELFDGARLNGRTSQRALKHAGFYGGNRLLTAARLLRTWEGVQASSSIERLADAGGFRSARTMRQSYRRILGIAPSQARLNLTVDQFARHVLDAILMSNS